MVNRAGKGGAGRVDTPHFCVREEGRSKEEGNFLKGTLELLVLNRPKFLVTGILTVQIRTCIRRSEMFVVRKILRTY